MPFDLGQFRSYDYYDVFLVNSGLRLQVEHKPTNCTPQMDTLRSSLTVLECVMQCLVHRIRAGDQLSTCVHELSSEPCALFQNDYSKTEVICTANATFSTIELHSNMVASYCRIYGISKFSIIIVCI